MLEKRRLLLPQHKNRFHHFPTFLQSMWTYLYDIIEQLERKCEYI